MQDDKVRLVDLAVFRKYSLALRQEFADPQDVLQALTQAIAEVQQASGFAESGDEAFRFEAADQKSEEEAQDEPEFLRSPADSAADELEFSLGPLPEPSGDLFSTRPAPAFERPSPFPSGQEIFPEDDPKSYLKRLAGRPPSGEADDLPAGEEPPDEPEELLPKRPAAAAAPKPAFESWEGEAAHQTTSEEDEEHFWGRAKRRPKKPRAK